MRILDRYILKSAVGIFFGCLLTFLFLYIVIDLFSHLDVIFKNRVGLHILIQYYSSFIPAIIVQVAPVACLIATLYTFARLNRDNEIIAMRASGLSILQITKTVIVFGVIVSIFIFWLNDKFVPQALSTSQKTKEIMESGLKKTKDKEREVIKDIYLYGLKNRLFYIKEFHPYINLIQDITILEHDEHQNVTRKIVANKGIYKDGFWRFYQSITYQFDLNGQIKQDPQYLEEEIMAIPETPQDFLKQRQRPEFMNMAQLDDYIWKLSKSGAVTVVRNLEIDLYRRFTDPLTSLIIIFLAIPFSLMVKKRATGMSSFGLAIMVGFLYYVMNAIGIALGKAGLFIPILAVSLSHLIVLTASLYLMENLP